MITWQKFILLLLCIWVSHKNGFYSSNVFDGPLSNFFPPVVEKALAEEELVTHYCMIFFLRFPCPLNLFLHLVKLIKVVYCIGSPGNQLFQETPGVFNIAFSLDMKSVFKTDFDFISPRYEKDNSEMQCDQVISANKYGEGERQRKKGRKIDNREWWQFDE